MMRRAVHSTFVRICFCASHWCEVRARVSVRGDGIFNHQIPLELLGCCPMPHGTPLLQRPLLFQRGTPTISIVLFRLGDTPVASEASELRDVATSKFFNSILLARPWEMCQLSPDRHLMHSQARPDFFFLPRGDIVGASGRLLIVFCRSVFIAPELCEIGTVAL